MWSAAGADIPFELLYHHGMTIFPMASTPTRTLSTVALTLIPFILSACNPSYRAVRPNRAIASSAPAATQGGDYLLYATFDRSAPELRFASSRNGYTWESVQNGKAFFTARAAFRDPSIVRGTDGLFHCVYTTADPRSIGYISSHDLVNWSAPRWLPVMGHEPQTVVTWAPELFWDRTRNEWLITWSSDVAGKFRTDKDDEKFIHRLYACTTKDFKTFSPTWLFFDPGHNVIDPQMVEYKGKYVLFYKDERLTPDRKVIMVTESNDPRGPYPLGRETIPNAPIEGSSALVFMNNMIVYFDAYVDDAMGAMTSQDLITWTDISEQTWFPKGHRHGSVLRVTAEEFARVVEPPGPAFSGLSPDSHSGETIVYLTSLGSTQLDVGSK